MKLIELHSKKYPGKFAMVDDKDFKRLNYYRWNIVWSLRASTFYARAASHRNKIYMCRLILNAQPGQQVDHKDHNGLNNQRYDIRLCTRSQNQMNQRKARGVHTSKYKGVCWSKQHQKWQSEIMVNKKSIFLGRFNSEIKAARAYDRAAIKLFDEYALLNFLEVAYA